MKKISKIAALLTTLIMVFSLTVGCGNKAANTQTKDIKTENTKKEETKKEEVKKNSKIVVGFAQIGAESGWRTAETESIKETAANDPEIELKFSDAQQKQENQIKAIKTFIAQKVDVIALAPVVESGWETVFKEAKDAGIPVILVDRKAAVDESLYTSFIGSDFVLEGMNAAKFLVDTFGKDEKVNIVELQGTVGSSCANDRKKGFEEALKDYSGYKILKSQSGDFTRAKGKEVMEAFLKSAKSEGAKIDALYAHNDDMALGAIQAIEEAGLKPGKDIKIVSIDGVKDAFLAIKDGKSNCTVECNPLLGPQLYQACKDLKNGDKLQKWIKSNEDVYFGQKAIDAVPNRKY